MVSPANHTRDEGGNTVIYCTVGGNPTPTVEWRFEGRKLLLGAKYLVKKAELIIRNLKYSDAGQYKCAARNILGSSEASGNLKVRGLPIFTKKPSSLVSKMESTTIQETCQAEGYPPPKLTWIRLVSPLPVGKTDVREGNLTIMNLRPMDSGLYQCVATNSMGTKKATMNLVVTDIDECSASSPVCDINANCFDTLGSYNCTCKAGYTGDGKTCQAFYKSCAEHYKAGQRISGVYRVDPDNAGAFDVYCDQTTAGGGWAVFQKRLDGSVDFDRVWKDYKQGFGNLRGEFWLGLDKVHRLTKERSKLRVELEDFNGQTAYAEYDLFGVAGEGNKYRLTLGTYAGTAGDSFSFNNGVAFSTKDQDNDLIGSAPSCAQYWKGGWWFNNCHQAFLNGFYYKGSHSNSGGGVMWNKWKGNSYSAKRAEMKIKPLNI
ncbi:angiopoietin-related protein 7-like [Porites lutea]|uniref:angiopoietin-related protein 7-like n=1 Tax=Porites lutea TaxID=51062 RepID=UPI003CC69DCE